MKLGRAALHCVLLAVAFGSVFAGCYSSRTTSEQSKDQKDWSKVETPKDWIKVDQSDFSFFIPPSMKKKDVSGIDTEVWQYEDDAHSLDIEQGFYAADYSDILERYAGSKSSEIINGEPAQWIFADMNKPNNKPRVVNADGSTPPVKAVQEWLTAVYFPRHSAAFGITSKTEDGIEISNIILHSIKFKPSSDAPVR